MTIKQFINAWAMVSVYQKEQSVLIGQAARFAQADNKDYSNWIKTLIE